MESILPEIKIGAVSTAGIIEDVYEEQFYASGYWRHSSLFKPALTYEEKLEAVKHSLSSKAAATITLYHGTDSISAAKIEETSLFGHSDGSISFMTSKRSEAKQYSQMKSKYRGVNGGVILTLEIPRWAVNKNEATGEYESTFQFNYNDGECFPTDESIIMNLDLILSDFGAIPEDNEILDLEKHLVKQFKAGSYSPHAYPHWQRVYMNAKELCDFYGVSPNIAKYFAIFHDAARENDMRNEHHGYDATLLADTVRSKIHLNKTEYEILKYTIENHTTAMPDSHENAELITKICWDSDRLDLVRLSIDVSDEYLFTDFAKTPYMKQFAADNFIENKSIRILDHNNEKGMFIDTNESIHKEKIFNEDNIGNESLFPKDIKTARFEAIRSLFHSEESINLEEIVREKCKQDVNNEDTKKTVQQLNLWIKNNCNIYLPTKVILYHGTSSEHDIENEGIRRTTKKTKKSLQSEPGYVYLSLYPEMARTFGEFAYPMKDVSVYAVEVPLYSLLPDKDQLRNKRSWSDGEMDKLGNSLAESLFFGQGARIKGDIEPYAVRNITQILKQYDETIANNVIKM